MEKSSPMGFMEFAQSIMPLPTAPYHEHFISAAVDLFVKERPQLNVTRDAFGNLLIIYSNRQGQASATPYLIATAHMDHPGLIFDHRISPGRFLYRRVGQVDTSLALKARVRLYHTDLPAEQQPLKAPITEIVVRDELPYGFVVEVPLQVENRLSPGSFAMWDVTPLRQRNSLLYGRACDDLAGLTAALSYLDRLCQNNPLIKAGLLLTRAEEIGFGGMLAAVKAGTLDKEALYINLECSSAKAGAILGDGPIVRVGDRWWIFDHQVTGGLVAIATQMAEADGFRFQRKLMDGGICEATVLTQAGYRTGALALPLKNYHNSGTKRLSPEAIHLDDAEGLVQLLVQVAQSPGGIDAAFSRARALLDQRLDQGYSDSAQLLRQTTPPR
jgi:endoglucanase